MRPQQQNRRMRGRGGGGNGNRKGPNPLSRSYESNGPDVKIRGTAQQIADKYSTLARDAQSSGDRVMAENYLQHAEHYNRIIAAAQAQLQPQQNMRDGRDDGDEDAEDRGEREEQERPAQNGGQQRSQIDDGSGPQPVIDGMPAEVALNERQRGNRANGAGSSKGNGHDHAETAKSGDAEAPSKAEAAGEESTEAKPKPVKRTRRPRAKKTEEPAADAEAPRTEEVAAQS